MEQSNIPLEKIFQSCSFATSERNNDATKRNDCESPAPPNDITSFFVDSSGRSSFTVPLEMTFDKRNDLDEFLAAKCFDPPPRNLVSEADQTEDRNDSIVGGETDVVKTNASVTFEVKSIPSDSDDTNQVTVEGVSVLSCSVENLVVTFKTKVTVRTTTRGSSSASVTAPTDSFAQMSPSRFSSSLQNTNRMKNRTQPELEEKQQQQLQQVNLSTSFKITPVLTIENGDDRSKSEVSKNDFSLDLTQLGLAAIPDQMQYNNNNKTASSILSTSNERVHETRLLPVTINVTLTNAFSITVQSISGPKSRMGNTLVSLTIKHSKTHNLPVTITNIAVHPGHSRHNVIVARKNKKINGNKVEVSPKVQQAICKYMVACANE